MQGKLVCPAISIALTACLLIPLTSAQDVDGRKVALLVGVQLYGDGTGLRNLGYTEKDVTDLAAVLEKLGYKVNILTWSEAARQYKDSLRPTARNIRDHLAAITRDRKPADSVLIAFTGHGAHLKKTDRLYFCPQDTDLSEEKSLVAVDDVMAMLDAKNCKAGSKILLMDACRNDPADGATGGTPEEIKSRTRPMVPDPPGGTVAMFSCSKGQISHESPTLKRGFLFHHVIEGLSGKAANKKSGEVTWLGLANYVSEELPESVRKEKGPKVIQTPEVKGSVVGQLVLARYSVADLTPAPVEERAFEIAPGVKMVFCWIPPSEGKVKLGSPRAEKDYINKTFFYGKRPEFLDTETETARGMYESKGFWLAKYPTTQEEWVALMESNPSAFDGKNDNKAKGLPTSRFPVETVSWNDCQDYVKKLNVIGNVAATFGSAGRFSLPHEDQWEYAARGGRGNQQPFYWGHQLNGTEANCDGDAPYGTTTKGQDLGRPCAVDFTNDGKYEKHPWGLCHMAGNVCQWCENPYNAAGADRVYRGGSWCHSAWFCRSASRASFSPEERYISIGFRVALVPSGQ